MPTIAGMLPRQVVGESVMIDGVVVPHGTVVGTTNMIHQRDADVFPEPKKFNPDRWLGTDVSKLNEAFTPFGIGPRACIGQKFVICFILYCKFGYDGDQYCCSTISPKT